MAAASTSKEAIPTADVKAHVMLFAEKPCRLVTRVREGQTRLPRFDYHQNRPYSPERCCEDLADALGLPIEPKPFRIVAELMPPVNDDSFRSLYNSRGRVRLLLLAPTAVTQLNSFMDNRAESTAQLTNVSVVGKIMFDRKNRYEYIFIRNAAWPCLSPCGRSTFTPSDCCAHTRVEGVSSYLERVVRDLGLTPTSYVQRHAWDSSAPLFKINTEPGWYYAKTPIVGSEEVSITECIAKLFPSDTLDIKATSLSLNCFISKGFNESIVRSQLSPELCLKKLARLQIQSIKHLDILQKAGLPDYSPPVLAAKIDELAAHPKYSPQLKSRHLSLQYITSSIKQFSSELEKSAIPNTLVHGDFTARNFGVRDDIGEDEGVIFFDWEGACVSHPFCDLYNNCQKWPSDALDEYLRSWSTFVHMEEARRYAEIGRIMGLVVRICHVMRLADIALDCDKPWFLDDVTSCIGEILSKLEDRRNRIEE